MVRFTTFFVGITVLWQSVTAQTSDHPLIEKGRVHLQRLPDSAIWYADKALRLGEETRNPTLSAKAMTLRAEAHQNRAELPESVDWYLKAINLSEKYALDSVIASPLNGLGVSYYYMNDLDKAELFIRRAADAKLNVKDFTYYSVILTNLAGILFYREKYNEAVDLLQEAEITLSKLGQRKYLASVYNSLGGAYQMKGESSDSVVYYYRQSLGIAREYDILNNLVTGYHNLGEHFLQRNDYPTAITFLDSALILSADKEDRYTLSVYTTLSEALEKKGDFKRAYEIRSKELDLNKKIFEAEKLKTIEELNISYETRKNEQEIISQREAIQQADLDAAKQRNRQNTTLFVSISAIALLLVVVYYFWQRKRTNQLLMKEKTRLFENIVHEIRTPLTLIKGPLDLIKADNSNRIENEKHIQTIEANADKLVRLVNELLDASKLDKGSYRPEFRSGNLVESIIQSAESFKLEAELKGIKLHLPDTSSVGVIHRYPANAIEKAVNNLLGNAIKFCAGGSTIHVSCLVTSDKATIHVQDNGPGISEKDQSHIFDRFYRAESGNKSQGTGIGLSFTKELVEMLGGSISVLSKPGSGATFTVVFPIEEVTVTQSESLEVDERPCVLIAEDDAGLNDFVSGLLENDFQVMRVRDGAEALVKIRQGIPDLVLSDIMMPNMDGMELLKIIKSEEVSAHIPVVLFSAKASLESKLAGLQMGADAYLPKPFNPEELKLTIHNLMLARKRNQEQNLAGLQSNKPFEERVRSENSFVNKAVDEIIKHLGDEHYSVNELADALCLSRSQLHRKLSATTGQSATTFIRNIRLERAKDLLRTQWGNVTDIAYACGFSSQSYFTKAYTEYFGHAPSKERG